MKHTKQSFEWLGNLRFQSKTIIIGLILVLVLIIGCEKETTVTTDEGDAKITVVGVGENDWCPEGGMWEFEGTSEEGTTVSEWKIDKLITSGKYAGMCHVVYTASTPEGDVEMEYYFSEDGESGYIEMDMMGQIITQEWHKS